MINIMYVSFHFVVLYLSIKSFLLTIELYYFANSDRFVLGVALIRPWASAFISADASLIFYAGYVFGNFHVMTSMHTVM